MQQKFHRATRRTKKTTFYNAKQKFRTRLNESAARDEKNKQKLDFRFSIGMR